MCGIVGGISNFSLSFFDQAVESISHRGPDSKGVFYDKNIALGHTRLSIQDLSENGNQPMISPDGRYVLIFNGEIYNHLDIRKKLSDKYTFKSTSDTETLLNGLIEYGPDILNMLNGIFAFAFYDKISQNVLIVRDHFGVKPLYYYKDENILLFGSEIKSFLSYPDLNREIDFHALSSYLTYLWSPDASTPFKFVKKLEPGHYIQVNLNSPDDLSIVKFYDIPFTGNYSKKSEKDLIAELEEKLLAAVERQMLSDVPVGFFLSGGVDSSALVAMARKLYPERKLQCFTIDTASEGQTEGFSDDLYYARIVAKHLNVDLEIVKADIDIVKDFDKMIYFLDEPQADPAPLNVYNISKRAREMGYKVLIGGTAGDDLFSGYRRHQALAYAKYFELIPKSLNHFLGNSFKYLSKKNSTFRRAEKLLSSFKLTKLERMKSYYSWLSLKTTKDLFTNPVKEKLGAFDPLQALEDLLNNIPKDCPDLNKMLYWELKTFLVHHNLNYTDKMSMAVGVEVRVPFLDKELVEFSTTIPIHLKMKGTTTKYLLKKVMEKYLPKEIIYRSKAGFGAPVRKWITEEMEDKLKACLGEKRLRQREIFDIENVWKLIERNKSGEIDASYPIWGLLAIESWFNQFVDKSSEKD